MPPKGAKLSPEQLEKLAKARVLAQQAIQEKKALNAGLNTKGKQMKKELVNNFLKEMVQGETSEVSPFKEKIEPEKIEVLEPLEAKPQEKEPEKPVEKAVEKITKKKTPQPEPSSSESENEQVEIVKVKKKKKPKKKVIYISESDSDSEPEIVYRQKSKSKQRFYKEPEQVPEQVPVRTSYGTHLVNLMRNGYNF